MDESSKSLILCFFRLLDPMFIFFFYLWRIVQFVSVNYPVRRFPIFLLYRKLALFLIVQIDGA